jgi:hypothetical protein
MPLADPRLPLLPPLRSYPYVRKCAFDVGDYGMGFCANSLQLGCDCLGHIKYFDAVMSDARGDPVVVRKAVCLHEEDAGIMWKHTDLRLAHAEVRRARRLVISMVSRREGALLVLLPHCSAAACCMAGMDLLPHLVLLLLPAAAAAGMVLLGDTAGADTLCPTTLCRCRPLPTTSTPCTGTCTRTAPSPWR